MTYLAVRVATARTMDHVGSVAWRKPIDRAASMASDPGWQPSGAIVSSDGDQSSTTTSRDDLQAFTEPRSSNLPTAPSAAAPGHVSGVDGVVVGRCKEAPHVQGAKHHQSKALRRGLIAAVCMWIVVVVLWLSILGPPRAWRAVEDNYAASSAMVFGGFVAGSTPLAGGSVGVPLMTLVRGHAPTDARDFSTALQAVGMNVAWIAAVVARIKIDWVAVRWTVAGAAVGMLLWSVLAIEISSTLLSVLFAAMWCGFAFCLGIATRLGMTASKSSVAELYTGGATSHTNVATTLFGFGVLGGVVSMLAGLGADTILFAVLVLRFRVAEHVAQPTSVVVMALVSAASLAMRQLGVGQLHPINATAQDNWYAVIPVVSLMAPLGVLFANKATTKIMVLLVCVGAALQYATTLFMFADTGPLLLLGVVGLLASVLFFHLMAVTSPLQLGFGSWMDITKEAKRLADITSAVMKAQHPYTMMFEDVSTEALYVRESMTSRYQQVFALVLMAAVSLCVSAHTYQQVDKVAAVAVSIAIAVACCACFALALVPRMVSRREHIACVALVAFDLQILLAVGSSDAPGVWTFATVVLSVQPVVMFTLLQVRAYLALCIQAVVVLLVAAVAVGASDGEETLLFVVSVLSTSLLGAYLCFHIERTARGNFVLRLALSDQAEAARDEARKVKELMKEVVQAQKAKKSQKWLARILGGIPSPMLIVSKLGYIKDANQPAEALFATNVKSLRGRDVLSLIVPDHREVFEPVLRRMRELRHAHEKRAAARRAALRQREIARVHRVASSSDSDSDDSSPKSSSDAESKDDPRRRALETSELQIDITTLDGRTVTVDVAVGLADQVFVVTFHDITERVALVLKHQDAVESKRNFLAFICHELRNPLNGICGMGELLLDTGLDEEQDEYAHFIHANAKSMLHIVNDVLDFSRVESNKAVLEVVPFDVRRLAKSLNKQYSILLAKLGNVEMRTSVDPDIDHLLKGDPARINQILLNFLSNAAKFTQEGSITLKIELVSQTAVSQCVKFSCIDTGVGIAPEDQQKLFQSYAQATSYTSRQFGGTGLGLAICKALVAAMGGQVTLRSAVGMGSTFAFQASLPRVDDSASVPASDVAVVRPVDIFEDNIAAVRTRVDRLLLSQDHDAGSGDSVGDGAVLPGDVPPSPPSPANRTAVVSSSSADGTPTPKLARLSSGRLRGVAFDDELNTMIEYEVSEGQPSVGGKPHSFAVSTGGGDSGAAVAGAGAGAGAGGASEVSPEGPAVRHKLMVRRSSSMAQLTSPSSAVPTILIVDDSVVNQRLIERWVHKSKLQVHCVVGEDGLEAVSLWRQHRARLCCILMDVNMPRMNGIDATKAIRAEEGSDVEASGGHRVPIIAVSANVTQDDQDTFTSCGMTGFMGKPVKRRQLMELIATHVGQAH